jgi:hypothetical protein
LENLSNNRLIAAGRGRGAPHLPRPTPASNAESSQAKRARKDRGPN